MVETPTIEVENGATTTTTKFTGGYKWHVQTTFSLGNGETFKTNLMMAESMGRPTVHMHNSFNGDEPNTNFKFSHSRVIDGFDEYENEETQ